MLLARRPPSTYDPPPMSSLTRYILRQCFGVMMFVTGALSAAIWLGQSLRLISLIVNRGLSLGLFLYLALLILPRFLDIVLPIGVFIAVLFIFNRLITESELVVMRAAGLSPFDLAKPALLLAGGTGILLLSLSLYFLPVSNREFISLLFEIRNRFVSGLIQEGTFTTLSDKLTIYVRGRDSRGELTGLLINDSRNPERPVTILAERGAFADTPTGPRIIMMNGDRQQYNVRSHKLSVMTFRRYTLDLGAMHDATVARVREPQELMLGDLLFPSANLDAVTRRSYLAEANRRIAVPLSTLSFCLIPLACLLPGQLTRRGQVRRVLLAVGSAFLFQSLELSLGNLALRYTGVIPLMYVVDLLPFAIGFAILLHGRARLGFRRPALAVAR